MPDEAQHIYEFGDFRLDRTDKILRRREGNLVPLTPKVFETLEFFIENAGRLIEKDELMRQVWQDRFVEENNLSFNIKMLRKALGDRAQKPQFIETVPRRGFRFIAEVREITSEPKADAAAPPETVSSSTGKIFQPRKSRFFSFPVSVVAVLIVCVVALGGFYVRSKIATGGAPVLSAPFALERIFASGKVLGAVITPDGKNVVYTVTIGGKQSVWLRQIDEGNNVEIIPPRDVRYFGLAVSPDGNFLYLARSPKIFEGQADIYRVSIFGGIPNKIIGETQGWISLSPDGRQISFVRCYYRPEENCSLWIADAADGANERKLVSRPRPMRIAANNFSPDGRSIAFAAGQSDNAADDFSLLEVNLDTNAERELTREKFFNIKHLLWLPGENGLLVTAATAKEKTFRIWQIAAGTGHAEILTKDAESYSALSLSRNADRIVSTQVSGNFYLMLYQTDNPAATKRILTDALTAAFAPGGKIIFSSAASGSEEIWSVNADGGDRRQLTSNAAVEELLPIVSADGKFIFFASNQTGEAHVWRMNEDGSDKRQITREAGGFPLFASPDGQFVYYRAAADKTLWRTASAGGGEQRVLDEKRSLFAFAPDGARVAFFTDEKEGKAVKIVSLSGNQIVRIFPLAEEKAAPNNLAFTPDGKSVAYILRDGESENNAFWQQSLDGGAPRKIADLGNEEIRGLSLAFASDGKTFALVQGNWRYDAVLIKGLKSF